MLTLLVIVCAMVYKAVDKYLKRKEQERIDKFADAAIKKDVYEGHDGLDEMLLRFGEENHHIKTIELA